MSKRFFYRIISILITAVLLTGCAAGGYVDTESSKNKASEELDVAFLFLPTTMDPQKATTAMDLQYLAPCTGLLYQKDEKGELWPELAEGYEVSEDNLTYTIYLRDGICYSDGTPITAYDFVYGFRRVVDPKVASTAIYIFEDICKLKNIFKVNQGELPLEELGVKAKDEKTLVIELEEPCPYFLYVLAMPAASPCNEEFMEKCAGRYATSPDTMLGSGAFYVDKYEPLGIQVHYKPNPYYVDRDKVKLPGINFRQLANDQQAEMAYQTHTVDAIRVTREYLTLSQDDPNLVNALGSSAYYIWCNFERGDSFQNRNIRYALSKAIDRDTLVREYYRTGNSSLTRIVPENLSYGPDGKDFCEDTDRYAHLSGYNPEEAVKYWEQGLNELGVTELEYELAIQSSAEEVGEILKDNLEKTLPGCKIKIHIMQSSQFWETVYKGDYDLVMSGWIADYPDPNSYLSLFGSDSSSNFGNYHNPDFDALAKAAQSESDPLKRIDIMHQQEDLIMNDMAVIPVVSTGHAWLISDRITNLGMESGGRVLCSFASKE